MARASKLIEDLTHIPNIIGGLGLSIAAAQKAFNSDYLDNIERLMALAKIMLGGVKADAAAPGGVGDLSDEEAARVEMFKTVFSELLIAAAPPRYQFTETTLKVKLDLAQSMDTVGSLGLGFGMQGVSVNAALTLGYSSDYRAAAEVSTVIHAIPADRTAFNALIERAKDLSKNALALSPQATVDAGIIEKYGKLLDNATAIKPAPTK